MRDMYLKGLSLALEDGCYIKAFCCSMHYPIVRVEKLNEETGTTELVAYAEHNYVHLMMLLIILLMKLKALLNQELYVNVHF